MSDVAFVCPPTPGRLSDLAHALRLELERQGMATSEHGRFPGPDPARLYVLVDPGRFIEAAGPGAIPAAPLLRRTITLTAQGAAGGSDAPLAMLRAVGRAFDISQASVSDMHRAGIEGRLLRPGYVSGWDRFDAGAERDVDVAIFDGDSARRRRLLADGADILARHRCVIELVDPRSVDTERRRALFRRAKLAIQLHESGDDRLDWLQTMDAMHSGAVIVAEQSTELGPLQAGAQLFVGSDRSWVWVLDQLLDDEQRLAAVRRAAYGRLRDWLPFSLSVGVLRAALLELLGRPLDDAGPADPAPLDLGAGDVPVFDERFLSELRRTQTDLRDVRRQLGRLQASVAIASGGRDEATVRRRPGWDVAEPASSAVLLTIGDDAAAAVESLDAIVAPSSAGLELVLVFAGGVAPGVLAWCDARPKLPIALVYGAPDIAAGRNAGLALVRAATCLVLDAGVVPYPRWRDALSSALGQRPDCGVAHGLQARRARMGNDSGLLGVHELAAPLAGRTEQMRDSGGFVGRSPDGAVEEDDLWRRIATRAYLVGEILSVVPAVAGVEPAREPVPA